jgi:hypothetical protein
MYSYVPGWYGGRAPPAWPATLNRLARPIARSMTVFQRFSFEDLIPLFLCAAAGLGVLALTYAMFLPAMRSPPIIAYRETPDVPLESTESALPIWAVIGGAVFTLAVLAFVARAYIGEVALQPAPASETPTPVGAGAPQPPSAPGELSYAESDTCLKYGASSTICLTAWA